MAFGLTVDTLCCTMAVCRFWVENGYAPVFQRGDHNDYQVEARTETAPERRIDKGFSLLAVKQKFNSLFHS